jgi:hypothetical protein
MQVCENAWRGEWRHSPGNQTALDKYRAEGSEFRLDIQNSLHLCVNNWRGTVVRTAPADECRIRKQNIGALSGYMSFQVSTYFQDLHCVLPAWMLEPGVRNRELPEMQ